MQATDATSGHAVIYEYGSSGNITSRQVVALGTLAASGTSADQGASGTQITVYGTGFSTTPGDDTAKIGGVTARVVSATQTELATWRSLAYNLIASEPSNSLLTRFFIGEGARRGRALPQATGKCLGSVRD